MNKKFMCGSCGAIGDAQLIVNKTCCGMGNKTTKKVFMSVLCILIIMFFVFHAEHSFAVDTDFFDDYGFGDGVHSWGSVYDKITWVDNGSCAGDYWQTLGVINNTFNVSGYCVNADRLSDSNYDICIAKDSDFQTECGGVMPLFPVDANLINDDWAEADQVTSFGDVVCGGDEGNTLFKTTKQVNRGQIQYFGSDTLELFYNTSVHSNKIFNEPLYGVNWFAHKFTNTKDYVRKLDIYLRDLGDDDLIVSIRGNLTSADLVSITIPTGSLSSNSWNTLDINDIALNPSSVYYVVGRCPSCSSSVNAHEWVDAPSGLEGYDSSDSGSSWSSNKPSKSLRIYGDGGCESKGTTGNNAKYDYYYIDEMFTSCPSDGASSYDLRGDYSVSAHVLIESTLCSVSTQCDADHDDTTSSDPDVLPSTPCRVREGFACNVTSDCWNDQTCDGAETTYDGVCDSTLVDIDKNIYVDGCNNVPIIDSITVEKNDGDCNVDGGFPAGYVCDDLFDGIEKNGVGAVYTSSCKGWVGNSCGVDSDCHHNLECISSFCAHSVTAVYTDNETDNKLYKDSSIDYDNSLSVASDNDIQYACWIIDNINTECDGNSTQCTSVCGGAVFDNVNWDNGFINTFSSGGNFIVELFTGKIGLYNDSYSESYCVSGDSTACFSCFDGLLNDDETSIDWGGHCGTPYFIRCNNGILDNVTNETSIDYGGACGNCDNSSIEDDLDLVLLIESGLITYPFNSSIQCEESVGVQGGIVFFVILISSILLLPVLLFMLILIVLLVIFGTGVFGLIIGLLGFGGKKKIVKKAIDVIKNSK